MTRMGRTKLIDASLRAHGAGQVKRDSGTRRICGSTSSGTTTIAVSSFCKRRICTHSGRPLAFFEQQNSRHRGWF